MQKKSQIQKKLITNAYTARRILWRRHTSSSFPGNSLSWNYEKRAMIYSGGKVWTYASGSHKKEQGEGSIIRKTDEEASEINTDIGADGRNQAQTTLYMGGRKSVYTPGRIDLKVWKH